MNQIDKAEGSEIQVRGHFVNGRELHNSGVSTHFAMQAGYLRMEESICEMLVRRKGSNSPCVVHFRWHHPSKGLRFRTRQNSFSKSNTLSACL